MNIGTSPVFLLILLFTCLKLTGHIDWSWWWVVSPFWIVAAVMTLIWILIWLIKRI